MIKLCCLYLYPLIEKIVKFMNSTVLRGYNEWRWNKNTKPVGNVVDYDSYDDWR